MPSDSESSSSLSSVGMSEFRLPPLTPCTHCHRASLACGCVWCICKSLKSYWRLRWTVITGVGGHDRSILEAKPCSPGSVPMENVLWGWLSSKWLGSFVVLETPIMPSACLGLMRSSVGLRRRGQQKACSQSVVNTKNIFCFVQSSFFFPHQLFSHHFVLFLNV